MENKLDAKDYEILRELDINLRQSFSQIGKKVGLSKNSIALRFEKLKPYMLHNTTGINNHLLGYTMVKVYYSFDYYDEKTEKDIENEIKKHKNILWAAKIYGNYDVCLCLFIKNLEDLVSDIDAFDSRFSKKINQKEIEIISKQIFFRHNFIHKNPINQAYRIEKKEEKIELDKNEKKILSLIRYNPRMNLIDLSKKTNLSVKTISKKIKQLKKSGIIMGYFIMLDPSKFDFTTFKLLIQVQNLKDEKEFETYLSSIKNIKYITKTLGMWDYEIDYIYPNTLELQKSIEELKKKFPNTIKKVNIISFSKRIATNKERFLMD